MRRRHVLADGWTVRPLAGPALERGTPEVPATVPGSVYADLLAAGLIPDPLRATHEDEVAWVGRSGWRFRLDLPGLDVGGPGDRWDLVLEGVDTAATVRLDGEVVLCTENMHRSHRLDVTGALRVARPHWLEVDIESPWAAALRHRDRLGPLPGAYDTPYPFLRTMACSFGWDWGPTLPGAALWRPVAVEQWHTARWDVVRPLVGVDDDGAGRVRVEASLTRAAGDAGQPVTAVARLTAPDGRQVEAAATVDGDSVTLELTLDAVERWWPHTLGTPVLHDLSVWLADADGSELDRWERRIGFRTIRLDTAPDDEGSAFTVEVNGRPVFVRGVNWIPDDPFPARVSPERYAARVAEVVALGADLVRVWGGGIYESDAFYDACDRAGVLVWQDFLFSCAAYPEEEPFAAEVEAEARQAVVRLMPHPSLALWCGNNENLWGHADWGWAEQTSGRTWGKGYYLELLPSVVAQLDPTRVYWPGSPWSGSAHHPNDPDHGCSHEWEVWNREDLDVYRRTVPRFLSEFGWQAPAAWTTMRDALDDEPLTETSPGVRAHQKADDGELKLARGMRRHTGLPVDGPDWVYRAQVVQARAATVGIEHLRSHRGRCMGAVWWQLNDLWPAVSWSLLDSAGRRKPAWYAVRRAFRPRLLTVQPRGDGLAAVLVNDTAGEWSTEVAAARLGGDGVALPGGVTRQARVPAYGLLELPLPGLAAAARPAEQPLRVTADGATSWWWDLPGTELELPEPRARVAARATDEGLLVEVAAETYLRDLCLLPDLVHPEAVVDDSLLTLAPGDSVAFLLTHVPPAALLAAWADTGPRPLRCLGDSAETFRSDAALTGAR